MRRSYLGPLPYGSKGQKGADDPEMAPWGMGGSAEPPLRCRLHPLMGRGIDGG